MFNLAWVMGHQFNNPFEKLDPKRQRRPSDYFQHRAGGCRKKNWRRTTATWAGPWPAWPPCSAQKNHAEALTLAFQALTILERAENKDVASSCFLTYLFAIQAREAGRLDEAEKQYRLVLSQATDLLGDEHPLVASAGRPGGAAARKRGDLPGAEKAIRRALDIGRHWLCATIPS